MSTSPIDDSSPPDRPWRRALVWGVGLTLAARIVAVLLAGVLWAGGDIPTEGETETRLYLGSEPITDGIPAWTLGVWQRHDTNHYIAIAEHGYIDHNDVVFPAGYPLAIRAISQLPFVDPLVAGLLIATIATALALTVLYRLTEEELGTTAAERAIIAQIAFPTAYILLAAYAEPVMLLFTILAFYLARHGRWWAAAAAGFAAGSVRLLAVVLAVPMAVMAWRAYGRQAWRKPCVAAAVLGAPLAFVAHSIYLETAGLPSVAASYRDRWKSVSSIPGHDVAVAIRRLFTDGLPMARSFALLMLVVAVALTVLAFRRLPLEYGAYAAALILLVLSRHDQTGRPLLSFSRHALLIFPGFMALGATPMKRPLRLTLASLSISLSVVLMAMFFMWGFTE